MTGSPPPREQAGQRHDRIFEPNTVRSILAGLEHLDELSIPSSTGLAAVTKFHEERQDLINHLKGFCRTLRALRECQ